MIESYNYAKEDIKKSRDKTIKLKKINILFHFG
jgi:hypothetical protein